MGFRYRKSINLGGGARITISKSGIGYSWGRKGFRFTKTASGRTRTTAYIPGTGLSFVKESSGKRKKRKANHQTATKRKSAPVVAAAAPQKPLTGEEAVAVAILSSMAILDLIILFTIGLGVALFVLAVFAASGLSILWYLMSSDDAKKAAPYLQQVLEQREKFQAIVNTTDDPTTAKKYLDYLLATMDELLTFREKDLRRSGLTREALSQQKADLLARYDLIISQAEQRSLAKRLIAVLLRIKKEPY